MAYPHTCGRYPHNSIQADRKSYMRWRTDQDFVFRSLLHTRTQLSRQAFAETGTPASHALLGVVYVYS